MFVYFQVAYVDSYNYSYCFHSSEVITVGIIGTQFENVSSELVHYHS